MRILMLKDYYFPEQCAGINLAQDLVDGFSKMGNSIDLYTPIPCRGISDSIRKEYKCKKKEVYGNAYINRYWLPYEKNTIFSRAMRYLLQNVIQIGKGLLTSYDVAFLGSTPPTMGIVGTILKKIRKKPFVYNLQDIFPDSLVTGGITQKGSLLWKIGRLIEKISYKNADHIIVISESFRENLLAKGVPNEKITTISNWIDLEQVYPISRNENRLYKELGLKGNPFLVVYAGNFGAAQGADVILQAANKLQKEDIVFIIFGGGSEFEKAKHYVENNKLKNVIVRGLLPMNRVSEVYSLGDIALITCKAGVGKAGMPSKTWSIMACNTPIVASFDIESELNSIITSANAGVCIEPEDSELLANTILTLKKKENLEIMKNGRRYVEAHASKSVCVKKYMDVLGAIVDEEKCNGTKD